MAEITTNVRIMKQLLTPSLTIAIALGTHSLSHAVWITNYTSISSGVGGSATGVWRDVTVDNTGAGTDSGFVVSMTTTGNVKDTTDGSQPSFTDQSVPWRDVGPGDTYQGTPVPIPISLPFDPQVNGDFANIETKGNATSLVTFNLGALVTNPVLSFSDIDTQTTLMFNDSITMLTGTANLAQSGNNISNDSTAHIGLHGTLFGDEAAGSVQFNGTFTQLQFSIVNAGPDVDLDDDRTGFVVSTDTAPVAVPETSSALLGMIGFSMFIFRRRHRG